MRFLVGFDGDDGGRDALELTRVFAQALGADVLVVTVKHGHFAHGGNPDDTAETWAESGFEADEVDEWLLARCFNPSAARDLDLEAEEARELVGVY